MEKRTNLQMWLAITTLLISALMVDVSVQQAGAATKNSVSPGPFDNPGTWNPPGIPGPVDDVIINSGHTINQGAPRTINSLTTNGTGRFLGNSSTLTISAGGAMTFNGGPQGFIHNGNTVVFQNGGTLTCQGAGLTFYNLTINSTVNIPYATNIDGTLTNNGAARTTRAISGTGTYMFGVQRVTIEVTTPGTLSQIQVDRIDSNNYRAYGNLLTGKYWDIAPTGSDYELSVTLPHNISPHQKARIARNHSEPPFASSYAWTIDRSTSTADSVTLDAVTELAAFGTPFTVNDGPDAGMLSPRIDIGSGEEDVLIYGDAGHALTYTGAIATGDINGDGIDDLVLGAAYAAGTGGAYAYFGAADFSGTKDIAGAVGSAPNVNIYGASHSDRLTTTGALALGDINGDDIDDIILGAYYADGPSELREDAGEVYIIYGSNSLPANIDLSDSDEDVTIYGATAEDRLGLGGVIEFGDLNGDGIDDLVLGAHYADGPSDARYGSGEVYVIYGSNSMPATIDLLNSDEDVTVYGARGGDSLSYDDAIALGDINHDGVDDLIVGAYQADGPSESRLNAGEAYIIYGSNSLPVTIDLAGSDEDVTIYAATPADHLLRGKTIAVGDINGDQQDDLLIGAFYADGPGDTRGNCGEAYVIYGSNTLPSTIDLASSDEDVTIYGATGAGLTVQGAIEVADIDGDGIGDLILGSTWTGEAYIIYGSNSLPSTFDLDVSDEDVTIHGAGSSDLLFGGNMITRGHPIAVGDLNADGLSDIIFGAYEADPPAPGIGYRNDAGKAYVICGSTSLAPTIDLNATDDNVMVYGATAEDNLTANNAIALGDLNNDGLDDIILGAAGGDGPGEARSGAGEAYVIFGMAPTVTGDFEPDRDVDWADLHFLTDHWLDDCNDVDDWCYGCDLDYSNTVDFLDFARLAACFEGD